MAPQVVTNEDLLGIVGKSLTSRGDNIAALSLIGRWAEVKNNEEGSTSEGKVAKSIHHFCMPGKDVQLPDPYRGIWRRYHVPSKHDFLPVVSGFTNIITGY